MTALVRVHFQPSSTELVVPAGAPAASVLESFGFEFPCGSDGTCGGCGIRFPEGAPPPTAEDQSRFSKQELAAGWRLACRHSISGDCTIELIPYESAILIDDHRVGGIHQEGFGIAIDLGTTTIAAQLIDLSTGSISATRTALNMQSVFGADVITRIRYSLTIEGRSALRDRIRKQIGELLRSLTAEVPAAIVKSILIVGNTIMHHFFGGLDTESLAGVPFEPSSMKSLQFTSNELGWEFAADIPVTVLRPIGGFVGSDILAGIIAAGIHLRNDSAALLDLGTNGEIVVATNGRLTCASAAAGPAFEGARISRGMRAVTGAITRLRLHEGILVSTVMGGGLARGLSGSGLLDAIVIGLETKKISPDGKIIGAPFRIDEDIEITQQDVRELQLAKAAIASGLELLCEQIQVPESSLTTIFLSGAFGNYMNPISALRIGLLPPPASRIQPIGNSALRGAKMILRNQSEESLDSLCERIEHQPFGADTEFMDSFVAHLGFPSE